MIAPASESTAQSADPATRRTDLAGRVEALEREIARLSGRSGVTLCVFSGDLDRLIAAFSIANSAAACGLRVCMFFTFWGTAMLRKPVQPVRSRRLLERVFGWLLPAGPAGARLSRLDMAGLGRRMILGEMRRKRIPDLAALLEMAQASGVEILACGMSMELMGIHAEDLVDYPNLRVCGATQFIDMAADGTVTLFV